MKLRSQMAALTFGAMTPLLVLAVAAVLALLEQHRADMARDTLGLARAAMTAMDAELHGRVATLQALAASTHLAQGMVPEFQLEAQRVLDSQPDWRSLSVTDVDAAETFRLNAEPTPQAPTASAPESPVVMAARQASGPAFGNVARADTGPPTVSIVQPVRAEGRVRYLLTVSLTLEPYVDVLKAQRLPPDWVAALVDREGRFIARVPPKPAGDAAPLRLRAAISAEPEGFFAGETADGNEVYTAFVTSKLSGWRLALSMPRSEFDHGQRELATALGFGVLLAVAAALGMARWVGRRISQPIATLATASQMLERGATPVDVGATSRIDELRALQRALVHAAAAVDERHALLEREKLALRSADRAKDEFLATLSHQLHEPLSALTAASRQLDPAKSSDPVTAQACGVIDRQTRHLARLVNDLLEVSRAMMGKIELVREPLDLAELTKSAMDGWRVAGRFGRHAVVLDSRAGVPVLGDRVRLEQVLSNLIDNALKFTPPGGTVTVRVRARARFAELQVQDSGCGFPAGAEDWLFDLFHQAEQAADHPQVGMGIGLAMVKRLVELHGGQVTARSAGTNQGASFTVVLPLD